LRSALPCFRIDPTVSILDRMGLKGKAALITGAGRGIGRGVARAYAEAGADLALVSRTKEQVEEAAAECQDLGVQAVAVPADVSRPEDIQRLVETAVSELGRLDILVNNAGTNYRAPALEYRAEDFDRILSVNLRGAYLASQAAARQMVAQRRGGRLICTTSLLSHRGVPGLSAYAASKGGLAQMVRVMAVEWAEHGITVNGISPGYIATALTQPLRDDQQQNDRIVSRIPMRRWGTPEDMAGMYVFLASDAAAYITGQLFPVDGGWLAG
ncbi:MAG: glucose 1-dehydrogenase, partial [Gemmatimonadota bacterium]